MDKTQQACDARSRPFCGVAMLATALSLTVVLSGCGTYLYSKPRDEQATAAKAAWKEVNTSAFFDKERERLAVLLKEQTENQARIGVIDRDAVLRQMVSTPLSKSLKDRIPGELKTTIGGSSDADIATYEAWRQAQRAPESTKMSLIRDNFEVVGLALPQCAEVANDSVPKGFAAWKARRKPDVSEEAMAESARKQLMQACADIKPAPAPSGGTVVKFWGLYEVERQRLDSLKAEAAAQVKGYTDAKGAYAEAIAANPSQVEEKFKVLKEAIDKLKATSGDNALVAKFLSEEQAKSLQEFLTSLSYDPAKPVTKGTGQVAALIELIPAAAAETRKQLAEGEKAAQTPLLIERNSLELKAAAASRDVKAQEAVVSLSKQILEAEASRADRLVALRSQLDQVKPEYLELSLTGAEAKALRVVTTSKDDKAIQEARNSYQGLEGLAVSYLETSSMETRRRTLEYQRWAAYHERTVTYSQDNVAQYQSAINVMLDQLGSYHSNGWTVDDVLKPLNAATLLWIGVGVN